MNKETRIKLVVLNENTLGYILPELPKQVYTLRADLSKGALWGSEGSSNFIGNKDVVRLASMKDFADYKVVFEGYNNDKEYIFATLKWEEKKEHILQQVTQKDGVYNLLSLKVIPLSSQLQAITGNSYNSCDFMNDDINKPGLSAAAGNIIRHIKTNKKFLIP